MVEVRITGAVLHMGRYQLDEPATISDALRAAGGLARLPRRWPDGPIHVRRRCEAHVDAWQFSLDDPQTYASFALHSGDLIVVQWHLDDT